MLDDYGVWNKVSERTLENLHLWPGEGKTKGDTYQAVNAVLRELSRKVGVTLWQLGSLIYHVDKNDLCIGKPAKTLSRVDELEKPLSIRVDNGPAYISDRLQT